MKTALDLSPEETAIVVGFTDSPVAPMLLDLGCRPGMPIQLIRKGYFRGPLYCKVANRVLAFRREEAGSILVTDPR